MQHLYVRSNCLIIFNVSVVKVTEMTTTVMIFLQFSDMVGRQEGHTARRKLGGWFIVDDDDLTGALHVL